MGDDAMHADTGTDTGRLIRVTLPAWLLTARGRPSPEQLVRLDEALAAVDDQGRRVRRRPICARNRRPRR